MSESSSLPSADVGRLLGLLVHDLRNPAATIAANSDFLKDMDFPDDDAREALADVHIALDELRRGLELVSWVGRWLSGQPAVPDAEADVVPALQGLCKTLRDDRGFPKLDVVGEGPFRARGGGAIAPVVRALVDNSRAHARNGSVVVRARREAADVVVEVEDSGRAVAPELRDAAFTLSGQQLLKGRADGRYGRFAALFACGIAASSLGARMECDGEDGRAIFRIRLPAT